VKDLLHELLFNEGHTYIVRSEFRRRISAGGYSSIFDLVADTVRSGRPNNNVGERVRAPSAPTGSPEAPVGADRLHGRIYKLANEMVNEGFKGQGMNNEENAEDYILMAADNPHVEEELPESGWSFWRACEFAYRRWKARRDRG
jgi:hypothetical protein